MNRIGRSAVVVGATAVAIVSQQPVAEANTQTPSGCHDPSWGGWTYNCWVGYGASTNSSLVAGAQTIARLYPHYYCNNTSFLQRDGIYGDATKNAVKRWQQGYNAYTGAGIAETGAVESSTWSALDTFITQHYSFAYNGWKYYTNDITGCPVEDTAAFFRSNTSSGHWNVLLPGNPGSYAYMYSWT